MIAAIHIAVLLHQQTLPTDRLHGAERGGLAGPYAEQIVEILNKYLADIIFQPVVENTAQKFAPALRGN